MNRHFFLGLFALAAFAVGSFAQDSTYNRRNSDTQQKLPMKVVDNGDGTFSMAVKDPSSASASSGTYKLRGEVGFAAPATVSRTGTGASWIFQVLGGSATFRVNGGDPIFAAKGSVLGDSFVPVSVDPSIDVDFLEGGATFQVIFGIAEF